MKRCIAFFLVILVYINSSFYVLGDEKEGFNAIEASFKNSKFNFESYNISAHAVINDEYLEITEIKNILNEINKEFGIDVESIKYNVTEKENYREIFTKSKNAENIDISIVIDSELSKENKMTNIVVDINKNEEYKDIAGNYSKLKNILSKFASNIDVYTCMIGNLKGKINDSLYRKIAEKIFAQLKATKKESIKDKNILSITGYSNKIKSYISYDNKKINLNVSLRYDAYDDKTLLYVGTPVIMLEY